jgi:hypothetical protein
MALRSWHCQPLELATTLGTRQADGGRCDSCTATGYGVGEHGVGLTSGPATHARMLQVSLFFSESPTNPVSSAPARTLSAAVVDAADMSPQAGAGC